MSRTLDDALDVIDAGLLLAAHDRLRRAIDAAKGLVDDQLDPQTHHQLVVDLLAELGAARCAADEIRQATA